MDCLAHVKQRDDGTWDRHPLEAHLLCVSRIAGEFAAVFASAQWGRLAGLWHDLGKYRPAFQNYIRKASGYEAENAHIGGAGKADHSMSMPIQN